MNHPRIVHLCNVKNNVNFETGTINSKQELWPKNPKKTSKTVLKTKSVYTRMMFFFRCQFWTCFKNGGDYEIYYEIFVQNIASKRKCCDIGIMIFLFRVNFQTFKKMLVKPNFYVPNKIVYEEKNTLMFLVEYHFFFPSINSTCSQP